MTVLYGCKDDGFAAVENPVQTGDEIVFGSRLSGNSDIIDSKTVYGDRTTTGVPVYWEEDGSDEIAIYCLQSSQPAKHLVHYNVTPVMNNGKPTATASSVTKVDADAAGLQWGDTNEEHRFYAFYPASAVKGSDEENETGMITASIPENQQVTEWITKDAGQAGAINGKRTYFGLPDMNYAYMYAYTAVDPSKTGVDTPVNLTFKNLVTVVDITVQGPATGEITVTNINVDAVDADIALAGDFTCNIRAANETGSDATCEAIANDKVRNRISIPCYDKTENKFITLKQDEYLNVKAYLIPDDNEDHIIHPQQLKITVSTLNGAAKSKTLQTADIVPHKINRVILPPLVEEGTNYWMSNLDPDIYISELSLPGSKQSFSTSKNGASGNNIFQGYPLETQFKDGVRAFVVQTSVNTTYDGSGNVTDVSVTDINTKTSLDNILNEIKSLLDEAKALNKNNEYAFVQITYDNASYSGSYQNEGAFKYWIEGIEYKLNQYKNNNIYNIYTEQITPDTKLGDVGGHIVLKVNYNDGQNGMGKYLDAYATVPALFSTWTKGMDDVALYWGTSNEGYTQTGRPEMRWYYSEATHIGNSNEAADITVKKNQISTVFQASVDKYINSTAHNYWFMNDVGGCYSNGSPTIPALTEDLNNYAVELLQGRTQNASLGIVLLNYADKQKDSGALYQSDWLIQTIIDNNFKFALRKASSASPSPVITNTRNGVSEDGWND